MAAQCGKKHRIQSMQIGTFHSICLSLLRDALPDKFFLLDEPAALELAASVIARHRLSCAPKDFLREISLYQNGAVPALPSLPEQAYQDYCALLEQMGALDFDGDLSSVRLELGRFLDERSLTKRYVDLGERIMALSEASGEDDVEGAVSEGEAFCEEIADFLLAQAGKRGVGARAGSRSPRLLYDAAVDALERGLLNEVQIEVYGRIERFAFGIVRRAAS